MFDELLAWLKLTILPSQYEYSVGQWVDDAELDPKRIIGVIGMGGPRPDVDDRRQRFRIIMLGARNKRDDMIPVRNDMNALALAALGDSRPCGAASVHALGEPDGPRFTTENRVYFTLDLEVLF